MAKIIVENTPVTVLTVNEQDFISLTDMATAKDGENRSVDIIKNRLRNRYAIDIEEFQRLKTEEQRLLGWSAKGELSKIRLRHTYKCY